MHCCFYLLVIYCIMIILTNTIFDVTSSPCCSSQPDKGALVKTTFFSLQLCSSMEKVYIYRRNSWKHCSQFRFNPHPLKGGCCNSLRFFYNSFFCPINCIKHFYVIFYTSFDVWGEIRECRLGRGVIKENGRRLMKSHDFYFVHFLNIWQDICFKLPM